MAFAIDSIEVNMCSAPGCKRDANALCLHCDKHVCTKHYLEHVKMTNDELLPLADQLNTIINTLQELNVKEASQTAIEQLEHWRQDSHERIDKLFEEKKRFVHKIIQSKLDEERLFSKQLNHVIQQHIEQSDASYQQVEKFKKDTATLTTRCTNLTRPDFCRVDIEPIELRYHSLKIQVRQCSYFTGDGTLLCFEHQVLLNEWIGLKEQRWQLVYKAKRDGFKTEDFHRCSNNQGPTLTVIQSKENGWLFGGYTTQSWTSSVQYVEDKSNPFLFTLINPHNILPTQYFIRPEYTEFASVHGDMYGPTFGGGFDLHVCNESNTVLGSYFKFPVSYSDTTGKGALTFTGTDQFQTSDIEIYRYD
ncbi:unnamed protein product [Adineta ricciae]|uniref:TLDc domain-containing protein n=1 Tax=Adineta ricciae TaxID=249248 RepID=A0A814LY11_ADIRI|nr:unnamed protein product [Adineta ricciae]